MNPKDLIRMLPSLLGAAGTIITIIALVVGLTAEPGEGSSNSSSNRDRSSTSWQREQPNSTTPSAPQESTSAPEAEALPTLEERTTSNAKEVPSTAEALATFTPPKGLHIPRTSYLPRRPQQTTTTTTPTQTPQFTSAAPVPTTKNDDPALNDPEVPATATLGYDEDGNRTATWTADGLRYTKTYLPGRKKTISIGPEHPPGSIGRTVRDGITYVTEYDHEGNPTASHSSGTYTPPRDPFEGFTPPPLTPREPSSSTDPTVEKQYTPSELQAEINRQFNEWNQYRVSKGVPAGVWDEDLANAAQKWANKLATDDNGTSRIYDVYPHERQYASNASDPTYDFVELNAGENVWMTDKQNLHRSLSKFKESPRHNKNLLIPPMKKPVRMGVGIAHGTNLDHNGRIPYYVVYKMY